MWIKEGKDGLKIGIIGMGYVGLPLALQFSRTNHRVMGFDIDEEKVNKLNQGKSYIKGIPSKDILEQIDLGLFHATSNFSYIRKVDAIIICVPTPLTKHREPDLSYIINTGEQIGPYIKEGQLIVLESTTFPGTTYEVLRPILSKLSGLPVGNNGFYLAYSPEREDPGNPDFRTCDIPKVVGGVTEDCCLAASHLYCGASIETVSVDSVYVAEATKLLENIFRCVNIALVNELKVVFDRMGIDVWEVIEAAKSKPFGYMPFYPGPGLGGHCIPIDPFYLTWKAREFGVATRFIELAGEINSNMPYHIVQKITEALSSQGKPLKKSRVLIVGMSYKKDVDDIRESPSLVIWELLVKGGAVVSYHDPFIDRIHKTREHPSLSGIYSVPLEGLGSYDCVLIATDHSKVNYGEIVDSSKLVVDARNACGSRGLVGPHIVKA